MEVDGHWQLGGIIVPRLSKDVDSKAIFTLFQCRSNYYELFCWGSWSELRCVYDVFAVWHFYWRPKAAVACWW